MPREELIRKLYSHPLSEFKHGELERRSTDNLERLLRLLDGIGKAQGSYDAANKLQMQRDEPPESAEEDDEILDCIWLNLSQKEKLPVRE